MVRQAELEPRGAGRDPRGRPLRRGPERPQRRLRERDVAEPPDLARAVRRSGGARRSPAPSGQAVDGGRALVRGAGRRRLVPRTADTSGSRPRRPTTTAGARPSRPARSWACPTPAAALTRPRCAPAATRRSSAAGAFFPGAATVHPARLAFGLRSAASASGACRSSRAPASTSRAPATAATWSPRPRGRVRAGSVVLATGGGARRPAAAPAPPADRDLEPHRDHRAGAGRARGARLDAAASASPTRARWSTTSGPPATTGSPSAGAAAGSPSAARLHGRAELDPAVVGEVRAPPGPLLPGARGQADRARLGRSDRRLADPPARDRRARAGRVHYASATPGNGVGPSHLAGRSLASLALERRDEATRLAIVDPPPDHVPPEPLRYVGGTVIRRAILRQEAALERGRRPGPLTRAVGRIPERIGIHVGR